MEKIVARMFSFVLSAVICASSFVSCGAGQMKEFSGDLRERYDYNLKEYLKVGDYKDLKINVGADNISERELNAKIMEYTVLYTTTVEGNEWVRLGEGAIAEKGNIAEVKYQGYLDGQALSDVKHYKEEGYSMTLGADMLIEGVDEHIIGMKIGDKKTIEVTVPDPCYEYPYYVGETLTLELELAGIRATELESYDEGLFEYYGCTTADDFEAQVISEIKRVRTNQLEDYVITRVLDTIRDSFEVKKYPDKELEEIKTSINESDKAAAEEAGMTFEEYIAGEYDVTMEQYNSDVEEYSKQLVFEEMVLYFIARNEQIALTNGAFDEKAAELAEENGLTTPAEYVSYMMSYYGYTEYGVREQIWFDMVYDFLYENAVQIGK